MYTHIGGVVGGVVGGAVCGIGDIYGEGDIRDEVGVRGVRG